MTSNGERPQIGLTLLRPDAWDKVTGRTIYATDAFPEGFLWGGVKRACVPHARLIRVETEAAARVPGVVRVLTHRHVPRPNRQGIVHQDQPVLSGDKVRRIGDPVALVLADTREALLEALELIQVDLEALPAVFEPEEALAEAAPLVHEDQGTNLMARVFLNKGDVDQGFDAAEAVVEETFEVPRQEHAYLETEGGWAVETQDGRLEITVGTQSPYRDRREVAAALGLAADRVRVIAPFMGGGFGGKDGASVQALLALAALNAEGRPVRMVWNREESFLAGVKRVPARLTYRVGVGSDGSLKALTCSLIMDGGPYDHLGGEVLSLAVEQAGGSYRIPHVRVEGRIAYTNNPMSGPFRGFGGPQVTAAVEQMMDLCAGRLGMDPLAFRMKNILRRGDRTSAGVTLVHSIGAEACLRTVAAHPFWRDREAWKAKAGPHKRRGVGAACLSHGSGYGPVVPDYATARLVLGLDGRFRVDASVVDMGQGNAATYLQMAGDILNQRVEDLSAVLPDTDQTLPACSSAASRTTYTYGNALIAAAGRLRERILDHAAVMLMAGGRDEFDLVPGAARHLSTGRDISLDRLAEAMPDESRVSTHYWRAPTAKDKLDVELTSALGIPHTIFSYATHLARIEVDDLTGRIDVLDYLAATDAGRVLNPQLYEQQVQGGIVQGLGYALCEDYMVEEGRGLTPNLATYILPTAVDAPDMVSEAVETLEATGPCGMKGVGEIPINGPLPVVANAVADACGVRTFRAPLTPERILEALDAA